MSQLSKTLANIADKLLIAFFFINLFFIVYVIDVEQLIIKDPNNFKQPIWPTAGLARVIHSYGRKQDPLLMARPIWFKITVWMDVLYFGPFYAIALYAFIKKKNWIRNYVIIWASMILVNLIVTVAEQLYGEFHTAYPGMMFVTYGAYIIFPILGLIRIFGGRKLWKEERNSNNKDGKINELNKVVENSFTAKQIFDEETYSVVFGQHSEWNVQQIRDELNIRWKSLSSSEKKKYSDKAEERNRNPEYQHKSESSKKRRKNN